MKSRLRSVLVTTAFLVGCFFGFLYQARQVLDMYFSYQTTTRIELQEREEMPIPYISVCPRYIDVVDRSMVNWSEPTRPTRSDPLDTYREDLMFESQLTVKQIFEFTPDPNDTVKICGRRSADMTRMDIIVGSCRDHLVTTKFYMQEHICYSYHFHHFHNYSFPLTTHSANFPNKLYYIRMNSNFSGRIRYMYITLHTDVPLPLFSRSFGKEIEMSKNPNTSLKARTFYVQYQYNEYHLLEPPYETMCNMHVSRNGCVRDCLIDRMKKIDRLPATEIIDQPIDLKHVTPDDLNNPYIREFVTQSQKYCYKRCTRAQCHTSRAFTTVQTFYLEDDGDQDTLSFFILAPDSASLIIVVNPKVTFLDFMIYTFSSFGLWFGMSVRSLNPMKLRWWWAQCRFRKREVDIDRELKRVKRKLQKLEKNFGKPPASSSWVLVRGQKFT